jgi:hypothetical protein
MKAKKPAQGRVPRKRSTESKSEHVIDLTTAETLPSTDIEVRGWLSFLALLLVVVYPVMYARILVTQAGDLPHLWRINPSLYYPAVGDLILSGVLAAAGCFAGIALLRKRRGAVTLTKRVLIAGAAYVVVSTAVLAIMVVGRNDVSPGVVVSGALPGLLFFAGTLVYLTRSKRVQATYGLVPHGTFPQFERPTGAAKFFHAATWLVAGLWAISTTLTLMSLADQNSIFQQLMDADARAYQIGGDATQARAFLGDVDDATLLSAYEERRVAPSALGIPRADYLVTMLNRRCVEGEMMVDHILKESLSIGWTKGPLTLAEELVDSTASGERAVRCLDRL